MLYRNGGLVGRVTYNKSESSSMEKSTIGEPTIDFETKQTLQNNYIPNSFTFDYNLFQSTEKGRSYHCNSLE